METCQGCKYQWRWDKHFQGCDNPQSNNYKMMMFKEGLRCAFYAHDRVFCKECGKEKKSKL